MNNDKMRTCVEHIRAKAGTLMINHPAAVVSIAVGIYAIGYYQGRSQALSKIIRLCAR